MDLGNGMSLDRVGKFCYLVHILSEAGGVNSASVYIYIYIYIYISIICYQCS